MQGLVTVFGGSGFIGSQVVRALARRGLRVRAAMRDPAAGYRLRMLGDVGQIEVVQANIRVKESLAGPLQGAEGCVNLVGLLYEAGRQTFSGVHEAGARNVAEAAAEAGVRRLAQVSAIGADVHARAKYARSKGLGEAAAREAFPGATILRPSIVFGPEDGFFNRFGAMAARSPVLPLIGGGKTRFQPVFVGDVAAAIANALVDPSAAGGVYELGGPQVYSLKALMELIRQETSRKPLLLPVPFIAAEAIGLAGGLVSRLVPPPLTLDQVELLRVDNVVGAGAAGLAELGVQPTTLESILPSYMFRYRPGGQYAEALARGV